MNRAKNIFYFKRATVFVALFFSLTASAANPKETYKDIINKAYNLSLQKDRSQAISLLLGALKKEIKKTAAQKELVQALDQVSKIFISDKAQQHYELGLSLKFTDPNVALSKLVEASRLEPENSSIEMAIAQQQMMIGDCDGAYARATKFKDLTAYLDDWRLISAQISICESNFDAYQNFKQSSDLKSPLAIYWMATEAEYLSKSNQAAKAKDIISGALKLDAHFPELYYWDWKISQQLKAKLDRQGQKYVSLCKTLNSRQQRDYAAEPFLCRRTAEVETFLKNNNNAE